MKSLLRQIRFLFLGARDLNRRIEETLSHHRELEERIARVDRELGERIARVSREFEERVASFQQDVRQNINAFEDLDDRFEDLDGRVVTHLQSMQRESDRFIRMTEIEFEAFRRSLLEASDEILRLSNQIRSESS